MPIKQRSYQYNSHMDKCTKDQFQTVPKSLFFTINLLLIEIHKTLKQKIMTYNMPSTSKPKLQIIFQESFI